MNKDSLQTYDMAYHPQPDDDESLTKVEFRQYVRKTDETFRVIQEQFLSIDDQLAEMKEQMVTKDYLKATLSNYPSKDDFRTALLDFPTKNDLRAGLDSLAHRMAEDNQRFRDELKAEIRRLEKVSGLPPITLSPTA